LVCPSFLLDFWASHDLNSMVYDDPEMATDSGAEVDEVSAELLQAVRRGRERAAELWAFGDSLRWHELPVICSEGDRRYARLVPTLGHAA
jgi:hypothetical protein